MRTEIQFLNKRLRKALFLREEEKVLAILKQGADPFYKIGTMSSPIYWAAMEAPKLVSLLLDPNNMLEKYRSRFEEEENLYILTAMMGTMGDEFHPNMDLLRELVRRYKGDFSATIPFFSKFTHSKGLLFAAVQCDDVEPLALLIEQGAKDVKVDWDGKNYAIHALLCQDPHFKKDFFKMLSFLLRINPENIHEYCPKFEGTCLEYFEKADNHLKDRYKEYFPQTVRMLKKAECEIAKKEKSITYLYHNKKNHLISPGMEVDISNEALLSSAFGQSIARRWAMGRAKPC